MGTIAIGITMGTCTAILIAVTWIAAGMATTSTAKSTFRGRATGGMCMATRTGPTSTADGTVTTNIAGDTTRASITIATEAGGGPYQAEA